MTAQTTNKFTPEQLFENNRRWADAIRQKDPHFFETLASQQTPDYLWIGCSDSRVPANELLGMLPGELFVHRNIANVVVHSDLNSLSVLQFAVDVLKVRNIIICGHYGCSGVHAAMMNRRVGLADNWLRHVQDVHQKHERYLGEIVDDRVRGDQLCELNVIEQVVNVCKTTIIQDAWDRGQEVTVHGWVYGLQDGLLQPLGMTVDSNETLSQHLESSLTRYQPVAQKVTV
ncbi:carbonate dehydratase [Undibacterium luofuense]|uniref:carbonate dehydratase n=1 Tax=Undibacterium luofuense TaxID=2828733 RepID=UPI0030EE846F